MYFRLIFISIFILSSFLKDICSGNRFLRQQLTFFWNFKVAPLSLASIFSAEMSVEILVLLLMIFKSVFKVNFCLFYKFYYEMYIVYSFLCTHFFVHIHSASWILEYSWSLSCQLWLLSQGSLHSFPSNCTVAYKDSYLWSS